MSFVQIFYLHSCNIHRCFLFVFTSIIPTSSLSLFQNLMFTYEKFQPMFLTTTYVANHISELATAPRPWAAFTNIYATTLSILMTRCPMNSSHISLPASPRIFPTILSVTTRVMTPIIPTPIYMLSTPIIRPISFQISKMMFVQFKYQCTSKRHRH